MEIYYFILPRFDLLKFDTFYFFLLIANAARNGKMEITSVVYANINFEAIRKYQTLRKSSYRFCKDSSNKIV